MIAGNNDRKISFFQRSAYCFFHPLANNLHILSPARMKRARRFQQHGIFVRDFFCWKLPEEITSEVERCNSDCLKAETRPSGACGYLRFYCEYFDVTHRAKIGKETPSVAFRPDGG